MFPGVNLHTLQTELLFYFPHSLVSLLGMAWSKVLLFVAEASAMVAEM